MNYIDCFGSFFFFQEENQALKRQLAQKEQEKKVHFSLGEGHDLFLSQDFDARCTEEIGELLIEVSRKEVSFTG